MKILLSIGIVIVALAAAGFFFWQSRQDPGQALGPYTPSPTEIQNSDWQTITNQDYSFSFRMPKSWQEDGNSINSPEVSNYSAPDNSLLRIISVPANGLTIEDFIAKEDKVASTAWEGEKSKEIISSKVITLAGQEAIERQENWLAAGFTTTVVYVIAGNNAYTISIIPNDPNPEVQSEVQKNFPQILSTFKFTNSTTTNGGCIKSGCSGQICAEKGDQTITDCMVREEYDCYQYSKCERQSNGSCGWTPTAKLQACLASY